MDRPSTTQIIADSRVPVIIGGLIVVVLYASSFYSYLLFHSLVEITGAAVTFAVFALSWNTRRVQENSFLLFLGLTSLFSAGLLLLHTLTYRGMGVLPGFDANLPTQLWIAARYLFSGSLLAATFFLSAKVRPVRLLTVYTTITTALLWAIFSGRFPACYIEGSGLTSFKITSEYVIIGIFMAAFIRILRQRGTLDPVVHRFIRYFIIASILSELSFTQYASVFGLANLIGHYFLLLSGYFLYRAIIVTGIEAPARLLFRSLDQREQELAESVAKYRSLFDNMLDGFAYSRVIQDDSGKVVDYVFLEVNNSFERITGLKRQDLIGKTAREAMPGIEEDPADWIGRYGRIALSGDEERFEQYSKDLNRWLSISAYSPARGYFAAVFEDITERNQARETLQRSMNRQELLSLIAGELLPATDPRAIVNALCRKVMEHLDCHACFNYLIDEKAGKLRLNTCAGIPPEDAGRIEWLDLGESICGNAAQGGISIVAEHIAGSDDQRVSPVKPYGIKAYACHPIVGMEGKVLGTLSFGTRTRETFSEDDLSLMKAVTDQVAVAIDRINREKALADSEERYRALIELSPDAIAVHSGGRYVYINPAGVKLYGAATANEITGKSVLDTVDPEFRSFVKSRMEQSYLDRKAVPLRESRLLRLDGRSMDVEVVTAPTTFGGQAATQMILRDITERKEAEAKVRAARDEAVRERLRLDAVLDTIPSGVMVFDAATRNITLQNRQVAGIFEGDLDRADQKMRVNDFRMSRPDGSLFPLEELPGNIAITTGEVVRNVEMVVTRKNGTQVTILANAAPLWNERNEIAGCVVVCNDITDRKAAETALRESAERLQAIFNGVNESLLLLDVEGQVLAANETTAQRFDTTVAEFIGRNVYELMPAPVRENRRAKMLELVKSAEPVHFQDERDGMAFDHVLYPIKGHDGEVAQLVVFSRNITFQKKAEEALRQSEQKYRLLFRKMDEGFALYELLYDGTGNPVDWRVLEANDAYTRQTGIERDSIVGRRVGEIFPEAVPEYLPRFAGVVATQKAIEFETFSKPAGRYLQIVTFPAGDNRFASTILDITERKQAEDRIRHFASFPLLNPNPVMEMNETGMFVFVNPAAQKVLKEEGLDEYDASRFLPGDMSSIFQSWDRKTESTVAREIVLGQRNFNITVHLSPQYKVVRIYAFDITRRKKAEDDLQAARDQLEMRVAERTTELFEQSKRLDAFFRHSVSPLVFLDREFNFVRVNEAYARICGRDVKDFEGRNHFADYPSDELKERFEQVVTSGRPFAVLARPFVFPDHPEWGVSYWDVYVNPIRDDRGNVEFLVFALNDVSEQTVALKALRGSEERYRSIFDHSMDSILLAVPGGAILEANAAACSMLGQNEQELRQMSLEDFLDRSDPGATDFWVQQAGSGKARGERTVLCSDGTKLTVELSWVLFSDSDGNDRASIILHDITERRRAEEELLRSDAEIRDLYNHAPCGYHSTDRDGCIIRINDTALAWLGYDRDEVVGKKKIDEIYTPESARKFATLYPLFIERGWATDEEFEWVRKDGRVIPVLMNSTAIYGQHGEYVMSRSTTFDITERKKAEQERTRLASVVESTADGVVLTDGEGIVRYVNTAFEKITGYGRNEIEGRLFNVLGDGLLTNDGDNIRKTVESTGMWQGQFLNKRKDGVQYIEDCILSPVRDQAGRILNYAAIVRDVTEKLRLESIAASVNSMNNIGYVFAGVRHEIGNPINSAKSILAVLYKKLDKVQPGQVREYVEHAQAEISRVENVLRGLKSYSLYETPDIRDVGAKELLKGFTDIIIDDLRDKGIELICRVEQDAGNMRADPRALQQVMLNFISNAVDALRDRPAPRIDITVSRFRGRVILTVADNGIGMTEQQQADLFKPFYTSKAHGTGLGLVIVKKMITTMHGDVRITSRYGEGTEVTVTLEGQENGKTE